MPVNSCKYSFLMLLFFAQPVFAQNDTAVVGLVNLHEMPVNMNLSRSMRYFLKVGNDSSRFQLICNETKQTRKLVLNIKMASQAMTWKRQLQEFAAIMPVFSKEFFLDSLGTIWLGRLSHTGDAAVAVTLKYRDKFGKKNRIPDYRLLSQFMMYTQLTKDLNTLLQPYGLVVKNYVLEKIHFAATKNVKEETLFENSANLPAEMLDAMVWINLQPLHK